MKRIINTKKAPIAIGPYSQAIVFSTLIFTSGQIGINPKNGLLEKGIRTQTKRTLSNIENILHSAKSSFSLVIKCTVYLKDIKDFEIVNMIYAQYFKETKPARSTVEISNLPKGALIEIDAIAEIQL